jgi:hypothetical protein
MTIAVVALWACIAIEAHTRNQAEADARISLAQLRRLRQDPVPSNTPMPWTRVSRPSAS